MCVEFTKHMYLFLNNPWPCIEQLAVVTKPTHAHKCTQVSYIMNVICVLHVSAILVAILREAHHKGWMYRDIVCELMYRMATRIAQTCRTVLCL